MQHFDSKMSPKAKSRPAGFANARLSKDYNRKPKMVPAPGPARSILNRRNCQPRKCNGCGPPWLTAPAAAWGSCAAWTIGGLRWSWATASPNPDREGLVDEQAK
jgi:hypothetical protein